MNSVFSDNLRRLRQAKSYTQEQAAERLGVSPQAVSRWECGTTLPDVLLLPAIAELYCVTVDDLFRVKAAAYRNEAHRLLAVYEASRDREDFLRADNEFTRLLSGGSYVSDDLRAYGVLYEIAMLECANKAMALYDEVIARGPGEDRHTYYRTAIQRLYLRSNIGLDDRNVAEQEEWLEKHGDDPWDHILLLVALYRKGRYEEAYERFQTAVQQFGDVPELYAYGGDICEMRYRYDDAFLFWDRALELDPTCREAAYAKAECREKLGQTREACELWERLAAELEGAGFEAEARYPRARAENCRKKM